MFFYKSNSPTNYSLITKESPFIFHVPKSVGTRSKQSYIPTFHELAYCIIDINFHATERFSIYLDKILKR